MSIKRIKVPLPYFLYKKTLRLLTRYYGPVHQFRVMVTLADLSVQLQLLREYYPLLINIHTNEHITRFFTITPPFLQPLHNIYEEIISHIKTLSLKNYWLTINSPTQGKSEFEGFLLSMD